MERFSFCLAEEVEETVSFISQLQFHVCFKKVAKGYKISTSDLHVRVFQAGVSSGSNTRPISCVSFLQNLTDKRERVPEHKAMYSSDSLYCEAVLKRMAAFIMLECMSHAKVFQQLLWSSY